MFKPKYPLHVPNVLFLTLSPLAAIAGAAYYIPRYGVRPIEIIAFIAMFFATGLSITAGYHRHFAHVSYKAHPAIRFFYLVFGACAMQNSVLNWASDHRLHHRYTDTDNDPYNAGKGFWWSHVGWILYQSRAEKQLTNVGDLLRDRWVRWQHRNAVAIALVVGFAVPALLGGLTTGRVFGMLLWAGMIRVVFVHHSTFFINSLAHMWGKQPYSRKDTSQDSWWLALLTNGEGYHNFHHMFPSDYRNGIRWFQWDPTKWLIRSLNLAGMTQKLHRVPPQLILRARMEVEALEAEKHLQEMPHEVGHPWRVTVAASRERLEHALAEWGATRARYWELKKAQWANSEGAKHWKEKLAAYESRLDDARLQWRELVRGLENRIPAPTPQ
jgi:stearoyl-CoA desaturase (delta-9 desaturase)